MANVTDSASVLVVPSGWSDGVLGSLQPDDGSSDFTFSRGSDLSATRVNEQGYIEKGYENLLLHSNTFDGASWSSSNTNITWDILPNQSGYDGSNNAWSIGKSVSTNAYWRQTGIPTGVVTHSFYAKSGSLNGVLMFGGTPVVRVNLDTGNTYSWTRNLIYLNVTDAGNGWKKIVFACVDAGVSIQPQDADNNLAAAGNIYIQNYQINYGLVELPYIDSGATRAKAGISSDQPRIDYANGNGAVLIEPQRTNLLPYSEYFDGWPQTGTTLTTNTTETLSPEGLYNASKLVGNGTSGVIKSAIAKTGSVAVSVYLKSVSSSVNVTFKDPYGGLSNQVKSVTTEWQRFDFIGDNGASFAGFWVDDIPTSGIYMWGAQLEQDAAYSTSYIPAYGTSQTRLKETATLTKNVTSTGTIYININAQTSRTLTFLGADISVTKGVNKIAMAYSPTALKVSHNGTIVANITRAFDTTALTQIQLGHRNNFEQVTDSINQFLTLDSFLNDTKLNELTA